LGIDDFDMVSPFDDLDDRTGAEGKPSANFSTSGATAVLEEGPLTIGATMTRARPCLLLPLLALAACATERKPLMGYDKPPPGILLDGMSRVVLWPMFDLPPEPQMFRPRLNGQDAVVLTSDEGFYDYIEIQLENWTAGYSAWLTGTPPGTYIFELVDSAGQSWGKSLPLTIPVGADWMNLSDQFPAVIFTHYQGQVGSWTIDPALQDSDPATDEITVTNLIDEDVVVERCVIAAGTRTGCTPVRTVAPGADFVTVETVAVAGTAAPPALFIHLASDANQSYQRNLVARASPDFGGDCQVERIIVHGRRSSPAGPVASSSFALSSCYGYGSGGM
jgi:hypothetical protein